MRSITKKIQTQKSKTDTEYDLVSKKFLAQFPKKLGEKYFKKFHIKKELSDVVIKEYMEQFYIHLSQDLRSHMDYHIEFVLQLVSSHKERSNMSIFYYFLGFEILKMIFQMSWLQHEKLYGLQKHQESFIKNYIKPIQKTHRINGIIVPKHETIFFAKRSYFVKKPKIQEKKLTELVMATFTTDEVKTLGFLIIRHLDFLVFDYEYIFSDEPQNLFIL